MDSEKAGTLEKGTEIEALEQRVNAVAAVAAAAAAAGLKCCGSSWSRC